MPCLIEHERQAVCITKRTTQFNMSIYAKCLILPPLTTTLVAFDQFDYMIKSQLLEMN